VIEIPREKVTLENSDENKKQNKCYDFEPVIWTFELGALLFGWPRFL
jgi:hypothetical protein